MADQSFDVIIIGAGIIGTATALSILNQKKLKLLIIEAEDRVAAHQTGNNSGVIHSGLYYKPGSLKAINCTNGRERMYRFCEEHNIKHERCGKLVVATSKDEIPALDELEKRGIANGLTNLKRLNKEELKSYEPHVNGIEGLFVGETGIVDYVQVTETYKSLIESSGGIVKTNSKFLNLSRKSGELIVETNSGSYKTKLIVNCAGLYSDRVAKLCGVKPEVKIIPFRGEYYEINKAKSYLVKNLIYPVPDPRFPFLGVHFTRMINGGIEAGPNAVLAFKREGYTNKDFSIGDFTEMLLYPGFWIMASKYYKMGIEEFYRSFSKSAFIKALQKLIPEIKSEDIVPGGAGVRAQALDNKGKLLDDFCIIEKEKMIHVLNAPSPAATASLSIGDTIAALILKRFS
ncbi:MAG: L-2-hydroxyglutarate oxidase [Ignavibacteria bacterium]|jgi:L-2-hydroxyglutarate oxidase|nr:L-2-hydroxyglutarate oxidase [Ignavibacteria bacterium]